MSVRPYIYLFGALLCLVAWSPARAQDVYKCGSGRSITYSQQPCSGRVINTRPGSVPVKPNPQEVDVHRLEQNRLLAQTLRRQPGETTAQFDTRRRRARMLAADREECDRLEKRIPVEKARMNNTDPEDVQNAKAALAKTRKRFAEMRC